MSRPEKRVAVFATEPVTGKIGGLGVRQLEVARELSRHFEVRLLTPFKVGPHNEPFPVKRVTYEQPSTLTPHIKWADSVYSISLSVLRVARRHNKPVAADLLVPEYFENLEGMPIDIFHAQEKCERFGNTISRAARILTSADFFLSPSERRRDFYLGQLMMLGRLRPDDYKNDPQFRSLIDVAPFGIPSRKPRSGQPLFRGQLPNVGADDFILLWGGSLANWFDAMTPLKAVARLKKKYPQLKLVFTGSKHPVWGKLPDAYQEVVKFSRQKRMFEKNVFIFTDWVPYEEHDRYLTESDMGVSTFHDHIENHFSFRIRLLDYFWGNLPVLTNPGNTQSELVEREGLGAVVPFADDAALAGAIERALNKPHELAAMRGNIRRVKPQFHWERVLEPLVRFCANPRRTASLFDDQGIPADRKQTSKTFVFDVNQFADTVPDHPASLLVRTRQELNAGEREPATALLLEYLDLYGAGLESPLLKNPLFDLSTDFPPETLAELVPDHPHVLLLQAKRAMDADELDRAQALVEEEISLFGETPEARFVQGLICQRRGLHAEAVEAFKGVTEALPGNLPYCLPLADALLACGKIRQARTLYTRIWRESLEGPHSGEEWIRTRVALAIAKMDAAVRPELETLQHYFRRDRTNETLAHLVASQLELEGQRLIENGNGETARDFYQKAWKQNGKTAGEGWIRVVAALSLARLDRDKQPEIETLSHCLKNDPENERLAYAVASILERQGRPVEAREMFEAFTTSFKDQSILGSVWYRLALLSPKNKQKQMVRKCLAFHPGHRAARDLLRSL